MEDDKIMIVKILKVKDLDTKDIPVSAGINNVEVCLCEDCGEFYVYEDQAYNRRNIASIKFCNKCLSNHILRFGYGG